MGETLSFVKPKHETCSNLLHLFHVNLLASTSRVTTLTSIVGNADLCSKAYGKLIFPDKAVLELGNREKTLFMSAPHSLRLRVSNWSHNRVTL